MISFGLITEGITDQIVLENILFGFFNNGDIPIDKKDPKYYRNIAKPLKKQKELMGLFSMNPSFSYFIQDLQKREITAN